MDDVSGAKRFFSSKFNLYLVIGLVLLGTALMVPEYLAEPVEEKGIVLHYFYLPTCPHCKNQEPIVRELEKELGDVKFFYHDASTQKGAELFYKLASEAGLDTTRLGTPTIILKHTYLVGLHSREQIIEAINECKKTCETGIEKESETQEIGTGFTNVEIPLFGRVDLTSFSLPALAVVLGLIDVFNPCAR